METLSSPQVVIFAVLCIDWAVTSDDYANEALKAMELALTQYTNVRIVKTHVAALTVVRRRLFVEFFFEEFRDKGL